FPTRRSSDLDREEAQHVNRRFKHLFVFRVEAAAIDKKACFNLGSTLAAIAQQTLQALRRLLGMIGFKPRAERAGERANLLGDKKVALHETLDGAVVRARAIP